MNARNAKPRLELGRCPRCGLYSGHRMVSETVPEHWYVICDACGYQVGPYNSIGYATSRWNHEAH